MTAAVKEPTVLDAWLTRSDVARPSYEWPAFMLILDPTLRDAEPPTRQWTLEDVLHLSWHPEDAHKFEPGGEFNRQPEKK